MAGLQRSVETFRRSGSSGLVWEDRFIEEMDNSNKEKQQKKEAEEGLDLRRSRSVGSGGVMERSHSNGGGERERGRGYRTGSVSPALDPPSPKVSACGFCGVFGKSKPSKKPKPGMSAAITFTPRNAAMLAALNSKADIDFLPCVTLILVAASVPS